MAVVTVRPNIIYSGASNYTATGAANAYAATQDNSDSSYIRKTGTGTASIILGFGTTTISASQTVRQVRVRARIQTPTSSGKLNIQLGTKDNSVNYFTSALAVRGAVATGEVIGQWYSTAPNGGKWTQSTIDLLRAQITEYKDTTDRAYIYELYIDVDVANQATVTVTAPTGTITTTAKPDVTWSVSDPDGDFASYYQVKVFNDTTYGAAGFDPSSAIATWDSGQIAGTDVSTTIGTYLTDGDYRVYVRTAKNTNGVAFWSGWAYSSITINLSPPDIPTLVATYDDDQNHVNLTATGATAPAFDFQVYEIQRTDDGGNTWTEVRYASELAPDTSYVATVIDNEPPRGITVGYRIRAVGTVGSNVEASLWSTTTNVTTVNNGTWLIKTVEPIAQVATNVNVIDPDSWEVPEQLGIFRPLGRKYPVVVSSVINAHTGSYKVITSSTAQDAAFAPLVTYQGMLLVLTPFGDQKYIRIISRNVTRTGTPARPRYEYDLGYVEISG